MIAHYSPTLGGWKYSQSGRILPISTSWLRIQVSEKWCLLLYSCSITPLLHVRYYLEGLPSINQVQVQPIGEEGHDGRWFAAYKHALTLTGSNSGTLKSWDQAFIGDTHRIFYENATKRCEGPETYARYQFIIQSSGMGKSRMVDELSKGHFVIPVNLRTSGTGMW